MADVPQDEGIPDGAVPTPRSGITWNPPAPYGSAAALEGMGAIAAPLLAGFSLTLTGLVIDKHDALRWPDATLLFLTLAAVLLLATVQCTFWARRHVVTPSEITQWWPDAHRSYRHDALRQQQWTHHAGFQRWSGRARRTYALGTLSLMVALTLVLVPNRSVVHLGVGRLAAIATAALAVLFEVLWDLSVWLQGRRRGAPVSARSPRRINRALGVMTNWFAGDPAMVTPPAEHPLMAVGMLDDASVEPLGQLQALRRQLELEQRRRAVAEALAVERNRTITALSDVLRGEGDSEGKR